MCLGNVDAAEEERSTLPHTLLAGAPDSCRQARGPARCRTGYAVGPGPVPAKFCEEVAALLPGKGVREAEAERTLEQKTYMKEGSSGYNCFINKMETV